MAEDDFHLDNEGTGFALDDEDFDKIFEKANEAATEDEDTNKLFSGESTPPVNQGVQAQPESQDSQEQINSSVLEEMLNPPVQETEPATVIESATVAPEVKQEVTPPTEMTIPTATEQGRIKIPTEADDLAQVALVIRIVDAYRELTAEEKSVSSQFITGGEEVTDESTYVVKVLNVDPMLSLTMETLISAKNQDPVERAFFVIDLSDKLFYSLGQLVSVFSDEDFSKREARSQYARRLVKCIEALDAKSMGFVEATQSVLKVTKTEGV